MKLEFKKHSFDVVKIILVGGNAENISREFETRKKKAAIQALSNKVGKGKTDFDVIVITNPNEAEIVASQSFQLGRSDYRFTLLKFNNEKVDTSYIFSKSALSIRRKHCRGIINSFHNAGIFMRNTVKYNANGKIQQNRNDLK